MGLFHSYLSGTEADGNAKLALADGILGTNDEKRRAIVIGALSEGLQITHFTRLGGAESQGSAPPLRDWEPSTKELKDYICGILERLVQIAIVPGSLSLAARDGIAGHLRGLLGLRPPLFLDVESAVTRVVAASSSGYWPTALESITQSLQYEGPGFPEEYRRRVEGLRELVLPRSNADRLHFYVTNMPWGIVGGDLSKVEEEARKLADEISSDARVLFESRGAVER